MKYVINVAIIILMFCCGKKCTKDFDKGVNGIMNALTDTTTISRIKKKADAIIEKEGYDLKDFKIVFYEDSNRYTVIYSLVDSLKIGGGATIIFRKKDLNILSKSFEQ
jgi:hypothetical protein